MKFTVFYFIIFLFFAHSFAALEGSVYKPEGLDVNDVSYLLPLRQGKPLPALNLITNSLLSSKIFEQVLTFESTHALNDLPYNDASVISQPVNWYVTSLRFEPCGDRFILKDITDSINANSISQASQGQGCVPRLRLVVQPFSGFGLPYPTALHLLFHLDESGANLLIKAFTQAKQAARKNYGLETTGIPLSIHPSLSWEAQGADQRAVANIIQSAVLSTLARTETKIEIVTLIIRASINHWKFVGGTVNQGQWKRFITEFSQQLNDGQDPEMLRGVEDLNCTIFSVCQLRPLVLPAQLNPAGIIVSEIFQDIDAMKVIQTPGHRTKEIHLKAEQIDNVERVHFFNTNCVSCHQSSNLRDRNELHVNSQADGLTPFVPKKLLNPFTNNVINFGYFGTIPRISTRTAAESVNVASLINQSQGLKNPGNPILDMNKFWKCIVSQDDFKVCF